MQKFQKILLLGLLLQVATAFANAEAPRRRFRGRQFFLARQEVEQAAVTPYPTADELKPTVSFQEVEENANNAPESPLAVDEAPVQQEPQPELVYGPPLIETEEEPPIVENETHPRGGEEDDSEVLQAEDADTDTDNGSGAPLASQRLVSRRRLNAKRQKFERLQQAPVPARLEVRPVASFFYLQQQRLW